MSDYSRLIEQLNAELDRFKYSITEDVDIPDVGYISYVKNPHPLKVRNLCALLDIPPVIETTQAAQNFFNSVRNNLLLKYGNAFLWKELEICFIIGCDNNLYQALQADGGKVLAHEGFSLNALMGTSVINRDTFECFHHSNWGLYFSGEHFKVVKGVVDDWCCRQRNKGEIEQEKHR